MLPGADLPDRKATAGRAQPPRPPVLSRGALEAEQQNRSYVRDREAQESRSVLRGLLLLVVLVLVATVAAAGVERAFFPGWWRHW